MRDFDTPDPIPGGTIPGHTVDPNETVNGLDYKGAVLLFSYDQDTRPPDSGAEFRALANASDALWVTPPAEPVVWNSNDFNQFQDGFSTSRSESVYPAGTEGRTESSQSGRIKDAHATIFSLSPSTRVLWSDSRITTRAKQNGDLQWMVDYRIDEPVNDTDESDGRTVTWSVQTHEIDQVCIVQGANAPGQDIDSPCENRNDGRVIGADEPGHILETRYNAIRDDDARIAVVAEVEARFKKVVRNRYTYEDEVCEEVYNETLDRNVTQCRDVERTAWSRTVTNPSDTVVVADQENDLTITRGGSASVIIAGKPSPGNVVAFDMESPWSRFQAGGVSVTNRWRFYTHRSPGWGELVRSDESGETRTPSGAVPVTTWAYQSSNNVTSSATVGDQGAVQIQSVDNRGQEYTINDNRLPKFVNLSTFGGSYQRTRTVAIEYFQGVSFALLSGSSLVYNQGVTGVGVGEDLKVRSADVNATTVDTNASTALVRITLKDGETGDPIRLGEDVSGTLTVDGKEVATNESGVVYVQTNRLAPTTVRFEPEPWYRNLGPDEQPYLGDQQVVTSVSNRLDFPFWMFLLKSILIWLTPFVLVMYFIHLLTPRVVDDGWPPWSAFVGGDDS